MATDVNCRGVLSIDDHDGVRQLTLDRPDRLNAFNDDLYHALRDALTEAAARDDVAVVVVTGRGRAFSAGADLGEMAQPPRREAGEPHPFEPFMTALDNFPKPLIAAVNGIAVGIGVTLLPHCDIVLLGERARLRTPFVSLGVTAEAASTVLLPALIGWQRAAEMLFTARWLDAPTALEWGIGTRLCRSDVLLPEALALARDIARMPVPSLVATRRLLLEARRDAVAQARIRETAAFATLQGGPANREALAAFRERREPDFRRL
jgi:enoyl-CoA hydratase/carnithine racemase